MCQAPRSQVARREDGDRKGRQQMRTPFQARTMYASALEIERVPGGEVGALEGLLLGPYISAIRKVI